MDALAKQSNGGLIVLPGVFTFRPSQGDHCHGSTVPYACRLSLRYFTTDGGLISYESRRLICIDAQPRTSIASSKARNLPTCRCRHQPSTSW